MQPFEVIEVTSLEVKCDGGHGALGHPRVFLHIDQDKGEVTCPYCSRQYVMRQLSAPAGHH
ncbi:MAG: zinc-finger domain-containing protein [Proteobacteria bacterium]|nr:zinc-finger domain-containing protein [Pseudomonadota bacterium]